MSIDFLTVRGQAQEIEKKAKEAGEEQLEALAKTVSVLAMKCDQLQRDCERRAAKLS